jgi:hypothetical protein
LQSISLAAKFDEARYVMDKVIGVAVLTELAIDSGLQGEIMRVWH